MFAIANPDASLFQRASGRAPQMRQRLLRQHGWALAIQRRMAADPRERGAARTALRLRCPASDEVPGAFPAIPSGAFAPLFPESASPSLNLFY